MLSRRHFLGAGAVALGASAVSAQASPRFRLSLAEWSIHRAIQQGRLTNLDFPRIARESGCDGLEFVNGLWAAPTAGYLRRIKQQMQKHNVQPVLIMVDDEGMMGHSDRAERLKAADNHRKWVDAAADLGCHSIRTNMYPDKQPKTPAEIEAFLGCCAESFNRLLDYAAQAKINVIIENHGGVSSDPDVVIALMKKVNRPNFGTLPDFGNFPEGVDKVQAVARLLPYAKGASYKCYFEGPDNTETRYDLPGMFQALAASPYSGFVGIEYEGNTLSELDGIKTAREALVKLASAGKLPGWNLT
jgi:L-ribulose-5-phosphate 3-epimerase